MSHKKDLRVQRTQTAIREAFLDLVVAVGFEQLTIQQIADRAKINRVTFYRHYDDKYVLAESLMESLFQFSSDFDTDPLAETTRMFEHIRDYADFYRAAVDSNGIPNFTERMIAEIETRFRYQMAPVGYDEAQATMPIELPVRYLAAAQIGFVRWWLENGLPFPPQQAAQYLLDLHLNGALAALAARPV